MKISTPFIIIFLVVILLLYFGWYYIFSVYEVVYDVNPKFLFADGQSIITIKAIPINSLGKKAPFRNAACEFEIIEGKDLVQVVKTDKESGTLVMKSKELTGNVVVKVKSKFSLMPSEIKIEILKNAA